MNLLYRIFRQNPDTREGVVMATSLLGVVVNLLLGGIKIIIGILASSIAVVSEGINNATDSATGILTMLGTKLSRMRPTQKHPFGFGRIEYLTSLTISLLIVYTAIQFLISSLKLCFHPEDLKVSYTTLGLVAASAVIKLLLGSYTIRVGKKVNSSSLVAVGTESRSDSIVSVVTIVSALIFLLWNVNLDAYAGILTSLFILKAGLEVLWDTISSLLGKPVDKELACSLYRQIRDTPGILNAADMMLHNYGPDRYAGSVNIEIDHEKPIGEIYAAIHALQLKIMHEQKVTMVFGIYAVDHDHPEHKRLRNLIAQFVRSHEHVLSYHALYLPENEKKIYCDLTIDYDLKDESALRSEFTQFMAEACPERTLELVLETDFV